MKTKLFRTLALAVLSLPLPLAADTYYSGFQNILIPTTFEGVFVDVDGGHASSNVTFDGCDINPFFGGVDVANSSAFQPARDVAGNLGTLLNLAPGTTTVSASNVNLHFGTGAGGSEDHLGTTFAAATEGYLGFKLGTSYGWMRVVFNGDDTSNAYIKDWAYDTSGSIVVGRVQQSAAVGSAQTVTLSPGLGESFTLASPITNSSGNTNSVIKNGAGATILTGTHTYTGTTAVSNGKLLVNGSLAGMGSGTGAVTVASGAILGGTGSIIGATTISGGGIHTAADVVTSANTSGTGTIGKETFGTGITYNEGSIFEWNLTANTDTSTGTRGINYDAINTAALAKEGTGGIFRVVLNGGQAFTENFWKTNRTWGDIFTNVLGTGDSTNTLASIFSGVQYANASGVFETAPTTGAFTMTGNTLTWTAVPEPSSALAGLLLAAGLLHRRRK
jgi:autotransporter-associated beta strand protein